ncbi:MAG TPA: hypothetical protein VHT03_03545 [Rhizomicrobium sp.]|nr:hypothetical protein [Rhizomicrobium sp.]
MLFLGFAVSLALNWPGQLSYDSVVQLHDGRIGHYNPWHPPVMSWMLGVADRIIPGTGLFILFDEGVVTASLVSLLWIVRRITWAGVGAALALVVLPQFVLYQGIVWKDVLFADSALAGFVLLGHAGTHWCNSLHRWILLGAAFLLLVLAALSRQNGALVIPFTALALLFMARREGEHWPRSLALAIGAALFMGVAVFAAGATLAQRSGGATGVPGQWKLLQLYDLIGEVKRNSALQLRELARVNPDLEELMRSDGTRLYTPARNDTLIGSTDLQDEFASTTPAAIAAQWNESLLDNPGTYLAVRAKVFIWLFFTPDPVRCDAYYTGVDGPPQYLRELGLARRFRTQDRVLADYASLFVHTPVFSHVTYAVLAVILIIVLVLRRRTVDLAFAALLACALAFLLSFFVIAIACDYRYLFFLDLASAASAFYCAATWLPAKNRRE